MPSDEANTLVPCRTCSRVCGHRKALHSDRGACGNEVLRLRCWRRGHPARTHLSQIRGAREPAPTTSPCNLSHVGAARNFTSSGESANRSLRKGTCGWTSSSGEGVFETIRPGSIGTSASCWMSPMQTRKRRYTYEEVVLITMVQPSLPPRRASVNTTLVRGMCPSTSGATNLHFSGGKLWAPRGNYHTTCLLYTSPSPRD